MGPPINEEVARIGLPLHVEYDLSRRQRLVPHLKLWGPFSLFAPVAAAGLLAGAVLGIMRAPWRPGLPALTLFAGLFWVVLFRRFFIGLLDVIVHPVRHMDIVVEEKGLGFLIEGERWWIFLDGVRRVEQLMPGIWTISHHNGTVINIPADVITQEQIDYIRAAGERGLTPEGIQATIERGRMIQALEAEERREKRTGQA